MATARKVRRNADSNGRRSRAREDEEDEYEDDEDEEEERPRSRSKSSGRATKKERKPDVDIQGGWGTFHKNRERMPSDFLKTLKVLEDEILIKFMDETPFASVWVHWIERKGKRSFVCLNQKREKDGGDCPLCHQGDVPKMHNYFNVIDFTDPEEPAVVAYDASMSVTEWLEAKGESEKYGPLNREDVYYEIQMVGGRHQLRPVRESQIEEDWEEILPDGPLTDEELDEYDEDAYDKDAIQIPTMTELRKVAKELDKVRD